MAFLATFVVLIAALVGLQIAPRRTARRSRTRAEYEALIGCRTPFDFDHFEAYEHGLTECEGCGRVATLIYRGPACDACLDGAT